MANFIKRGKVWQYEISYKNEQGKFSKVRKSGFRTKSDASIAATEMENELNKGYAPDKKNILFSDYFENWMELYKKDKISDTTYKNYVNTYNNIIDYFEYKTLGQLTKSNYQQALNNFAKGHSKVTTKRFHTHMRACLSEAFDEHILLNDVTRNAIITGDVESKKSNEKFLNLNDFKRLLKAVEKRLDVRYSSNYMILLAAMTGLRFSEALGLTWNDINFDELTIKIDKTWDYKTGKGFAKTKTEFSVRTIDIDSHTASIMKKYMIQQKELLLKNGVLNTNNLIFYNLNNGAITDNAVNKTLRKVQKQLNIEPAITFHGLRHTHASILLYKGVDIMIVSERLGHANVSITQDVYSHVLEELREANRHKITDTLSQIYA